MLINDLPNKGEPSPQPAPAPGPDRVVPSSVKACRRLALGIFCASLSGPPMLGFPPKVWLGIILGAVMCSIFFWALGDIVESVATLVKD